MTDVEPEPTDWGTPHDISEQRGLKEQNVKDPAVGGANWGYYGYPTVPTTLHEALNYTSGHLGAGVSLPAVGSWLQVGMSDPTDLPEGAVPYLAYAQLIVWTDVAGGAVNAWCIGSAQQLNWPLAPGVTNWIDLQCDVGGRMQLTDAEIAARQIYMAVTSGSSIIWDGVSSCTTFFSERPSVDVLSPVGPQSSSTLAVTWQFNEGQDAQDPVGQVKYQMKVFNAAQYGDPAFDPELSVAFFDSGVVVSAAETQEVTGLADDSYRAYVKVDQQTAGIDQWSKWSFSPFSLVAVATTKNLSYWDGAVWLDGPVRYSDGAAFVDAVAVKYWDGTAWVEAVN